MRPDAPHSAGLKAPPQDFGDIIVRPLFGIVTGGSVDPECGKELVVGVPLLSAKPIQSTTGGITEQCIFRPFGSRHLEEKRQSGSRIRLPPMLHERLLAPQVISLETVVVDSPEMRCGLRPVCTGGLPFIHQPGLPRIGSHQSTCKNVWGDFVPETIARRALGPV